MSLKINIDIRDSITPVIGRIGHALTGDQVRVLNRTVGEAVAQLCVRHFGALNEERHHAFAPVRGFYEKAAKAVSRPEAIQPTTTGVDVEIDHEGLLQRFQGGPIDARPGSALTIPVNDEAYGHRALEFNDLVLLVLGPQHIAVLARAPSVSLEYKVRKDGRSTAVRKRAAGQPTTPVVMYLLLKHVEQRADSTVLPTEDAIAGAARIAAANYIDELLADEGRN